MKPSLQSIYRTHTCNALSGQDVGNTVTLSGWVERIRDHGGVVFVDLRDNYGTTQIVFSDSLATDMGSVRVESVVKVSGVVVARTGKAVNPKLPTGEIEVHARALELLSKADVLPFQIAEDDNAPEQLRLAYRFLDLRRTQLHRSIHLRSAVIAAMREIMGKQGFVEFQTPILTSSSPEGARDFLVPSRMHPGRFFALPQAPQQFKQLLMVAGFDRYFQIAPCFRDEDPRADRSPGEFYQLDFEMSFVEQEDVFAVAEQLFVDLFSRFSDWQIGEKPFPRIPYAEAMRRFGSDKPDLRIKEELVDVTECLAATEFAVLRRVIEERGIVVALPFVTDTVPSRKFLDDTVEFYKQLAGTGLGYLLVSGGEVKGTFAKQLSTSEIQSILQQVPTGASIVVFIGAGDRNKTLGHMGKLRLKVAAELGRIEKNCYRFCWITDFPMFEWNEDTNQYDFGHNPFSMPQGGMQALNEKSPGDILAYQYDIVCNGVELTSGAIRNHDPEIMYRAFEIAGYARNVVDDKFGGMIRAFKFGAPPHGGMAPGVDRIVMLLADTPTIREVIAFPMAQSVEDLMMAAPSAVSEKQLKELGIMLRPETVARLEKA
jgi:aspartyl-tRNA synthetase